MSPPGSRRVIRPAVTVAEESTRLGEVLATGRGLTLYTFAADKDGMSACAGTCAVNWPPLTLDHGARPVSGVRLPGRLGTITRPGGATQVTFDGHPLYRFAADTAPGQVRGQGLKGVWFVIRLDAPAAESHASPPTTTRTHAPRMSTPATCIPQGGGDEDADNSGGASDGDGCT